MLVCGLFFLFGTIRAQEGKFFGASDDVRKQFMLQFTNGYHYASLTHPIYFYDYQGGQNDITITKHGVVGIGHNNLLQECPPLLREIIKDGFNVPFIAPFWLPNNLQMGTVTKEEVAFTGNEPDRLQILKDINNAFLGTNHMISRDNIKSAIFITWDRMKNDQNTPRPQTNVNSFQLALINVQVGNIRRTYATFIYRILSYFNEHNMDGTDQKCPRKALAGLHAGNTLTKLFPLTVFFPFRPDWVIQYSNQQDFKRLGRYTFLLEIDGAMQPHPPTINCIEPDVDEYCRVNNWFGIDARIQLDFCKYREPGIYPYPLSCDRFIKCGVNHLTATVFICPKPLHFNPLISVCDWKKNIECNIPPATEIQKIHPVNFTKPPRQVHTHNNTCILRGHAQIPDPSTCDGFVACTNSRTINMVCPLGPFNQTLFFQPLTNATGICTYRKNVVCVNGIRPVVP